MRPLGRLLGKLAPSMMAGALIALLLLGSVAPLFHTHCAALEDSSSCAVCVAAHLTVLTPPQPDAAPVALPIRPGDAVLPSADPLPMGSPGSRADARGPPVA